jgi:hypothetical protein
LLISGVSAMGKMWKIVEQWCFSNGKMWKIVEQWCFSNGENVENCGTVVFQQWGKCGELLNSGVSAMGKM